MRVSRWFPIVWVLLSFGAAAALRLVGPDAWWGHGATIAFAGHLLRLILVSFLFASSAAAGDWLLAGLWRWGTRPELPHTVKQKDLSGSVSELTRTGPLSSAPSRAGLPHTAQRHLLSVRIAIGFALLSILLFGLAAWGLWRPWVFALLITLQGLILVLRWPSLAAGPLGRRTPLRACLRQPEFYAGLALVLLYGVPSLITALAPPIGWDDQVYHLPLPKAYLAAGGFFPMTWNFFAQQPGAIDLLYGWALSLGDGPVAALIHFGLGITTGLGLWEVARRLGFRRTAWIAPALFFCHFMVGEEMGWAFNDVGMAAFLLPAWWTLWQWSRGRTGRYGWLAAGLAGGMVAASKYTGGILLLGIGLWVTLAAFVARLRRRSHSGPRHAISLLHLLLGIAGFGVIAFLILLPWLVKNAAFTGNPIWPLLYSTLDGQAWSETLSRMLMRWQWADYGAGHSPLDWFLLLPRVFIRSDYSMERFAGSVALMPLAGAVLGLIVSPERRRLVWPPLGCFLVLFALWSLGSQQTRFLIPALPLLALSALPAINVAFRFPFGWTRFLTGLALVVTLVPNLVGIPVLNSPGTAVPRWHEALQSRPMLEGRETRDTFLSVRVRSYPCFRYIKTLSEHQRGRYVQFLFEPMGYYAEFPYRFDVPHASPILELAVESGSGQAFAEALWSRGIDTVVVNHAIFDEFLGLLEEPPTFQVFGGDPALLGRFCQALRIVDDFLHNHAIEEFHANQSAVYRVHP